MAAIQHYIKEIFHIASEKRFWLCVLGEIDNYQIWLVRTRSHTEHEDPKVLIVAGFHGEEKAGPYTILKWMKDCDSELLKRIDISFIPIVNPTAFAKNTRYNIYGEKSNCGFCHPENKDKSSREGQILINNIDLLRPLAEDGYLSLHEDMTVKEYYIYTFEKSKEPGDFSYEMLRELGKHFRKPLDGVRVELDANGNGIGPMAKEGLVYRHCDGSFDDWMFHLGVPWCCVNETPGKYRLKRRIDASIAIINKFVNLCIGEGG